MGEKHFLLVAPKWSEVLVQGRLRRAFYRFVNFREEGTEESRRGGGEREGERGEGGGGANGEPGQGEPMVTLRMDRHEAAGAACTTVAGDAPAAPAEDAAAAAVATQASICDAATGGTVAAAAAVSSTPPAPPTTTDAALPTPMPPPSTTPTPSETPTIRDCSDMFVRAEVTDETVINYSSFPLEKPPMAKVRARG